MGDVSAARREIVLLSFNPDRGALEGRLAEQEGNERAAIAAYLRAGDFESLTREVSRMETSGKSREALSIQREIVRRLGLIRTQPDALADAWWRLGQVCAKLGYQEKSERAAYRRQAFEAYEQALSLAPFSQTYLLNAGYEAFDLGDFAQASALFSRARDADPKSVNALVGLGRIAFLRGDHAQAHAYLAAARGIDPALPDVRRLAQELGE
jgi:tetratricopeptide (TPR) repeat protein